MPPRRASNAKRPQKRKADPDDNKDEKDKPPSKRPAREEEEKDNGGSKQADSSATTTTLDNKLEETSITINRAPVLELWGACVAHLTHPDLSWALCLSIGSSISTITAIAKGRSIGTIAAPADEGNHPEEKGKKRKDRAAEDLPTIHVMGFPMATTGDSVMVKGKPRTTREVTLQRKFGTDGYERVKGVMMEALEEWKGSEGELDGQAFKMYEKFRPDVSKGQKGWGRKGELHLSKVKDAVGKPSS
ncbi:hypothetical protein M406DRAFT_69079 [Cryphonectria parasitica EP155]|uniref:Uncharacterized protein n=1 Tax=Cryphonectria parasitica (strain ATCC 38755 / EP155) TaxID=660469 RepID=A0A9P4Y5K1_CRYP1|nr:uncharacterized protein M406DRAFT_69079 [Cryphonectria parasitica EP155]KAF3766901.1 hypothetical protein M406DRAFT_69079 [Cryphonectria parasitica EP155]